MAVVKRYQSLRTGHHQRPKVVANRYQRLGTGHLRHSATRRMLCHCRPGRVGKLLARPGQGDPTRTPGRKTARTAAPQGKPAEFAGQIRFRAEAARKWVWVRPVHSEG